MAETTNVHINGNPVGIAEGVGVQGDTLTIKRMLLDSEKLGDQFGDIEVRGRVWKILSWDRSYMTGDTHVIEDLTGLCV